MTRLWLRFRPCSALSESARLSMRRRRAGGAGKIGAFLYSRSASEKNQTFKVNARRARKNYPMTSMELNAALGEKILESFPQMKVDVHNPEILLNVEIREKIYIYSKIIRDRGNAGRNKRKGNAAALRGIDSPVADI